MIFSGYFGINPWQRGTTFAAVADGAYTADRFVYNKVGAMVHTVSKSSDAPANSLPIGRGDFVSSASLLLDCTTADAAIAAGDLCTLTYKIEGYDYNVIRQQEIKLAFWVRATKTGIYCVAFRNSGTDRSYVVEYTVNASDTWEEKLVSIDATPTAGTWDYEGGIGLQVSWVLAAGSNFQTTANAWQVGNFLATANQVNGVDNVLNNFRIEGIRFGLAAHAIDVYPHGKWSTRKEVLGLCQRYYEKSYDTGTVPGTVTNNGISCARNAGVTPHIGYGHASFAVTKRAVPTVTWYSPVTGAINNIADLTAAVDEPVASSVEMGEHGIGHPITTNNIGASHTLHAHWTASAEL